MTKRTYDLTQMSDHEAAAILANLTAEQEDLMDFAETDWDIHIILALRKAQLALLGIPCWPDGDHTEEPN
jgi:hypothetical protein